jgi:hypothetical protein
MKELTKGKLVAIILSVIFISNTIVFYILKGNPYSVRYDDADGWTTFTGLSIGWVFMMLAGGLIFYIFDKWGEKL